MLYIYTGTDTQRARTQAHELRSALARKRPSAEHFTLTDETFTARTLDELLYGQGLFETKYIVTIDASLADAAVSDAISVRASEMADAAHAFICISENVPAACARKLKKYAHEYVVCDAAKKDDDTRERFALPDALGARDRRGLWVALQRARAAGTEPEALHGLLFWQAKNMLCAAQTETAAEAGMKAFPYKKARQFAGNYTEDELRALTDTLITIYHDARRGMHDLDVALERFTLNV